jgi:pyruvate dehydrogenase complex dehydrogenase (E1) component
VVAALRELQRQGSVAAEVVEAAIQRYGLERDGQPPWNR